MNDDRIEYGRTSDDACLDAEGSAPLTTVAVPPEPAPQSASRELQRLTVVTEILKGWVWETDAEHRFTYLSDSVSKHAGKPPAWHYGRTRRELGNLNQDDAGHQAYLSQIEAREKCGPLDFVRYPDGKPVWFRTIGLPQFDANGTFTGHCGLVFEVTAEIEQRQGNRRGEARHRVARTATISDQTAPSPIPCVILDVSASGARLDVHASATVPQRFKLLIDIDGSERLCEVVWRRNNAVGVRFCDKA